MGRKTKIIATTITMPYAQQHNGCICSLCEARVVKDEIE